MEHEPSLDLLRASLPELEIINHIGTGGFKAVYRIVISGHDEALKVIYVPEEAENSDSHNEIPRRIHREIESLRACTSRYIVKLGALSSREINIAGKKYILYSEEYLDGQSVGRLSRGPHRPDFASCKLLFACLFDVIKELKALSLIHRDIKPDNVMATGQADRSFVVLDLGIAFKIGSTPITANPACSLGTLQYMAPEMLEPRFRETINFRSDLYAAAITVYEYGTGVHPIAQRGENCDATMFRILNLRPRAFAELRPDFPLAFCLLIDNLMHKTPALRPTIAAIERTMEGL